MRPNIRRGLAAAAALAIGITCAARYAQLAAPYYAAVDRLIAAGHPWEITGVGVSPGKSKLSEELQMEGYVRRDMDAEKPDARVIGRVQVGEVIETPMVFWTLLLLWPATSIRQRAARLMIGVPVFLGLEAITTATQLALPLAQASAILAGDSDPVTACDHWSRFLEAGGQFVLICCGAFMVVSAQRRFTSGVSTS